MLFRSKISKIDDIWPFWPSLYVDDLIFTGNDELMFTEFKNSMKHEFDMTDLSKMRYFLGLEVLI